jgi:hypothetical protein
MYCPRCGVLNLNDAKFCRACGADVSLVPQALEGRLPGATAETDVQQLEGRAEQRTKPVRPPTLEAGLESLFMGIGLVVIFLLGFIYFTAGFLLWVWLIIPGLASIGSGIGKIARWRALAAHPPTSGELPAAPPHRADLSAADTSEIAAPPPSVTENATRRLAAHSSAE